MATILAIIQKICVQIGIPQPTSVVTNNDAGVQQLLRLVQQGGNELMKEHSWSVLRRMRSFTGTAAQEQPNDPPSDFDRFVPNTKIWNVNDKRHLAGALSNDDWLRLTVEDTGGAIEYWTMLSGKIHIFPVPTTDDEYKYTYVSQNWIMDADGTTPKAAFTADTDTVRLPDELMILSGVWRWKDAKGLDYAEDFATYERRKEKAIGDDRGPHVVSTASGMGMPSNFWPWEIGA